MLESILTPWRLKWYSRGALLALAVGRGAYPGARRHSPVAGGMRAAGIGPRCGGRSLLDVVVHDELERRKKENLRNAA